MTVNTWLDHIPIWLMFGGTIGLTLAVFEAGYRTGRVRRDSPNKEKEGPVAGSVTATLTLLALLLAFVFSFAAGRFEERRRVLIEEANNIGTCYLRTSMIPEPHGAEARKLLVEYVDTRLAAAQNEDDIGVSVDRSLALQKGLWNPASAVAIKEQSSIQIGLFVQSLNAVIDSHSARLASSVRARLPGSIWIVLYMLIVVSFGGMGYQVGLCDSTRSPANVAAAFAFATTLWLVIDLERPHQGLLRVSQQPMIDLRNSLTETSTPAGAPTSREGR
jgi:hypothetical protein